MENQLHEKPVPYLHELQPPQISQPSSLPTQESLGPEEEAESRAWNIRLLKMRRQYTALKEAHQKSSVLAKITHETSEFQ